MSRRDTSFRVMGDQSIRSIVVAMHTTILLLTSAHYHGALAQERALSSVDQRRLRHRPLDTYTFEQERHQHQQQGQFREGHDKKRKQLQQRKQLLASSSSCDGSIGWHADMTNRDGCSDGGDDYPKEWLDNNNGEQEFMFFSTSGECCAALFKGKVDCKIYDHGCHQEISSLDNDQSMRSNDNDTKPTCFSIGWHIEMKYQLGCSDDDNLDDEWRKPGIKELMVFPTAEECCDTFFDNDSRDCQIYNSGCQREDDAAMIISIDNISCNAPWHPDFEAKVGCSNKENVPEDWTELFDSARACCEKYSVDGVCPARDMCSKTKDGVMHYLSGVRLSCNIICSTCSLFSCLRVYKSDIICDLFAFAFTPLAHSTSHHAANTTTDDCGRMAKKVLFSATNRFTRGG